MLCAVGVGRPRSTTSFARGDRERLSVRRRHRLRAPRSRDERCAIRRHVDAIVAGASIVDAARLACRARWCARVDCPEIERDVAGGHLDLQEIRPPDSRGRPAYRPTPHERAVADLQLEMALCPV